MIVQRRDVADDGAELGISPDAAATLEDFVAGLHPEDAPEVLRAFAFTQDPALRTVHDVEYRTVGKEDGLIRWVAAKGRSLFNKSGLCIRAIGTAIDITERKKAELCKPICWNLLPLSYGAELTTAENRIKI